MTERIELNSAWQFRRLGELSPHGTWQPVDLPHSPFVADLDGAEHWFGRCEYRRELRIDRLRPGQTCALYVGAAMHTAIVTVDGRQVGRHEGGYLPFELDLTDVLRDGESHEVVLELDNRDNADIPPGKPYRELDFCWYGGLYRNVELRIYPPVHITEAIAADEVAGGGVFLRTLSATLGGALVDARVHVRNAGDEPCSAQVAVEFWRAGCQVARAVSAQRTLPPAAAEHFELQIELLQPALWSPSSPSLYDVRIVISDAAERVLDRHALKFGVRRLAFSRSGGFCVNGERLRLHGTNRHQEFPRVGYAAPRPAQFRDARRIKEAGFDYVRLSHYPQSPDFLEACDELGIVVMNAIPGWQFVGGERFRAFCIENARQLVRRDRNHACVVLWELSLNETDMPEDLMAALHTAGHEEFPGDQMFTCGWIDRFDVYNHSRQHGRIHRWQNGDKALVVAEYGDWEYYAANEGFDQTKGTGLLPTDANSRKFRGDGERGLRQQAQNHIEALDDTLASPAVLDGQWATFDYARGYASERAACGVLDMFRLPKFSYHFYRSQRSPLARGAGWSGGPMVFIASHWIAVSNLQVLIFSNCEALELTLNDQPIRTGMRRMSAEFPHLPFAPFVATLPHFEAGTLEAVGFVGEREAARHRVTTPGVPNRIELHIDAAGLETSPGEPDLVTVHASTVDESGTLCVDAAGFIYFAITGNAEIVGPTVVRAEAGIASVVVRVPATSDSWEIHAVDEEHRFSPCSHTAVRSAPADARVAASALEPFAG